MNNEKDTEFFIGYLPKMPVGYSAFVRRVVIFLILITLGIATIVSYEMDRSVNSRFEYGTLTEIEGVLYKSPVPILKVISPGNREIKSILLTNYLKHGAHDLLDGFEKDMGMALSSKYLKVRGTLIYYDGATIMELTDQENSIIEVTEIVNDYKVKIESIGSISLSGEIVDSKCYFGAMNPGLGKTHKSCAALCLAGGITPVLAVHNVMGEADYFIILGENGQPINPELLPFVGDQINLIGEVTKYDDWYVVFVNPRNIIKDIKLKSSTGLISMLPNCGVFCGTLNVSASIGDW